ncbi:MAG: complex I subunit 1 family protein [Halobacteria archaeon]|nr:complex I subunit 1 family protein [Halobacteria archaeon]
MLASTPMATFTETVGFGESGPLAQFGVGLVVAFIWTSVILTLLGFGGVWFKRKWNAAFGDRVAVNRVGPFGLLIIVADSLKLLAKEVVVPNDVDRLAYWGAPILSTSSILLSFVFIPWGSGLQISDPQAGLVLTFGLASIPSLGVVMAGYGSNNKYSFLGFEREVAQAIAYEIPFVISAAALVPLVAFFGDGAPLQMSQIVAAQQGPLFGVEGIPLPNWFIFAQPLAAVIFFVAMLAEVARNPFDLPEAASELVAGYLTEYGGVNFTLMFLTEFAHMFLGGAIFTTLFLGGGAGPVLPAVLWFVIKMFAVYAVIQWLRATIPRVRIDQLLQIGWKRLLELSFLNLLFTTGIMWVTL